MQLRSASVNEIAGIDLSFSSLKHWSVVTKQQCVNLGEQLTLVHIGKIGYFVHYVLKIMYSMLNMFNMV